MTMPLISDIFRINASLKINKALNKLGKNDCLELTQKKRQLQIYSKMTNLFKPFPSINTPFISDKIQYPLNLNSDEVKTFYDIIIVNIK